MKINGACRGLVWPGAGGRCRARLVRVGYGEARQVKAKQGKDVKGKFKGDNDDCSSKNKQTH